MDPINQRPSLDIKQTSTEVVFRGDTVTLEAVASDPESHFVFFRWRAYLCTDEVTCDQAPFYEKSDAIAEIVVANVRNDDPSLPVRALRVVLHGQDAYGAVARPEQQLFIAVADRPPTLRLFKSSTYNQVVDTPVNVYAEVGDPDDGPLNPTLTWQVYTPTNQPGYELVDLEVTPDDDPTTVQYGKTFKAKGEGEDWIIEVTATDQLGEKTTQQLPIVVGPDLPPCLRTLSPIVAPAGTAWPMSEPTLFQVHVVADDLDPYPTINDQYLGTTRFTWSLKPPGATARQVLTGVTGNSVPLDPATYQPGDIVELRVEIADRNLTPITCADANATCSVIADNNCIQRQTWRVEVR